jgi:hypothetical protein
VRERHASGPPLGGGSAPRAGRLRLLPMGEGAGRDARGSGRLDAEPRRRVVVPRAGAQPRARRHDSPPAVRPVRRELGRNRLDHDPPFLQRLRGVPAHVPASGRRRPGGRVPRPRPDLPALGVLRASVRRGVPRPARPVRGTRRSRRSGATQPGLEFCSGDDLIRDLPGHLYRLQEHCFDAGSAIVARYFRETAPLEWST